MSGWRRPGFHPRWRTSELVLLLVAGGVALAATAAFQVSLRGGVNLASLRPAVVLVAAFGLVHLSLVVRGSRADPVILPAVLVLMGVGLALNQHLAPSAYLARRQWLWMLAAVAVLAAVLHIRFPLRWLRRYRYSWGILGVSLVALTLVFGHGSGPDSPRLSLGLGPWQFQPAEVLKVLVVVYLAGYLADRREVLGEAVTRLGPLRLPPLPYLAPLGIILGGALAVLAVQRDLGAALLLYAIGLGMLYLASGRITYVVLGAVGFLLGAYALHAALGIVQVRTAIWLDPWADPSGFGHQIIQALEALAAGGVTGTGLGLGMSRAIPVVHTDFVYAALVEELGLAGSAAVLAVYGILFWRGFRVAMTAGSTFPVLLSGGLVLALVVQTFVIVGGIVRLIPMTGITLPFLAHGGSSLVMSAVMVGLVARISDEAADGALVGQRRP